MAAIPEKRRPQPKSLDHMSNRRCARFCFAFWSAPMPFYIRFPAALFLVIVGVLLTITTVTIALVFADIGNPLIGNLPLWTWTAWLVIVWFIFFTSWALFNLVRQAFLRSHYKTLKVRRCACLSPAHLTAKPSSRTFCMECTSRHRCCCRAWAPFVRCPLSRRGVSILLFVTGSSASFGASSSSQSSGLCGRFGTPSPFVRCKNDLSFQLLKRFFIIRIQNNKLWDRIALLLWREEMLQQMIVAAEHRQRRRGLKHFAHARGGRGKDLRV